MRIAHDCDVKASWLVMLALVLPCYLASQEQRHADKYACSEPAPESLCTAANACGSTSVPCDVDIKRTSDSTSVTASTPDTKSNKPFCVKAGTTVNWKSTSRDTGFLVDFGTSAPFESLDAIIGGSDRSRSLVAKKPGCYRFSAGACVSGATYGMCDSVDTELIVTNGGH